MLLDNISINVFNKTPTLPSMPHDVPPTEDSSHDLGRHHFLRWKQMPSLSNVRQVSHFSQMEDLDDLQELYTSIRLYDRVYKTYEKYIDDDRFWRVLNHNISWALAWALYTVMYQCKFEWSRRPVALVHPELVHMRKLSLYAVHVAKENGTLASILKDILSDDSHASIMETISGFLRASTDASKAIEYHRTFKMLKQKVSECEGLDQASLITAFSATDGILLKRLVQKLAGLPKHNMDFDDGVAAETRSLLYDKIIQSDTGKLLVQSDGPKSVLHAPESPVVVNFCDYEDPLAIAAHVLIALTPNWFDRHPDSSSVAYSYRMVASHAQLELEHILLSFPGLPWDRTLEDRPSSTEVSDEGQSFEDYDFGRWLHNLDRLADDGLTTLKAGMFEHSKSKLGRFGLQSVWDRYDDDKTTLFELL